MMVEEQPYITAYTLAEYRLGRDVDALTGRHFEAVDVPMLGGCSRCGATIAAYNAFPSRDGYWKCADCIEGTGGWVDVADAHAAIFVQRSYRGEPGSHSITVVSTGVDAPTPYQLMHVVKHSPTGFSWGYDGSGPSELARCILIDLLGPALACPSCEGRGVMTVRDVEERCWECHGERYDSWLQTTYMRLRSEKIALQPMSGPFRLEERTVRDWLDRRRKP